MNNPSKEGWEWLRRYVPAAEVTYSPPCKGGGQGGFTYAQMNPPLTPPL